VARLDLLAPSRYESGFLNWANQNFLRIQQAFGKVLTGGSSGSEPNDPTTGDVWIDSTTKTFRIWDGADWKFLHSYEAGNFTPTIIQSVTVSRTITSCTFQYSGDYIEGEFLFLITGSGTNTHAITIGTPTPSFLLNAGEEVGTGYIFDASSGTRIPFQLVASGGRFLVGDATQGAGNAFGQAGTAFAQGLVNGDAITGRFKYRWA